MTKEIFEMCVMYGVFAVAGYILIIILGSIAASLWEWVDDDESKVYNPIIRLLMGVCGFEFTENRFREKVKDKAKYLRSIIMKPYDGRSLREDHLLFEVFRIGSSDLRAIPEDFLEKVNAFTGSVSMKCVEWHLYTIGIGFALFLLPLVATVSFLYYPIALAIFTVVLIAFLARAGRRHNKLFKKHCESKSAHQFA
jgi:hypothetical protein